MLEFGLGVAGLALMVAGGVLARWQAPCGLLGMACGAVLLKYAGWPLH